jgi:DNA primase
MILRQFYKIVVAPDNDEAGEKLVIELAEKLPKTRLFVADYDAKDPAECPVDELRKAIRWAERVQ